MYQVIIADDEPSALKHICTIINYKCPGYQVAGTADNGRDALEQVRIRKPDVLISDVKMPIMDGIELVSKVKEEFPDILSVIVSGYQDFDYAKGAIQSGVCDYLLKPLKPAALKERLDNLRTKLAAMYYEKRNKLLRNLCNTFRMYDKEELKRYFPADRYYVALIRRNGLPRRFSRQTGIEIFSMEEEKMYIYGRDEMESLYLCPQDLLFKETFSQMIERVFRRQMDEISFLTAVVHQEAFSIDVLPNILKRLYRKLDESVVIGKNQLIASLDGERSEPEREYTQREQNRLERLEYLVKYREYDKLVSEIDTLFKQWKSEKRSQLYVEAQVRMLFHLLCKHNDSGENYESCEFMIDDAFYYAASMEDLKNSVIAAVDLSFPDSSRQKRDDKSQLFDFITDYMERHLEKPMTLNSICREFGVSQTSLSKMFRAYQGCSFNNHLTKLRIDRAKQILETDKEIFIKDVAERVGYNDQFYFSRIFRSVVGVCPTEYLEQLAVRDDLVISL